MCNLKSKVFNNVEAFESSVEYSSTEVVNNGGKVKGTACAQQCWLFGRIKK